MSAAMRWCRIKKSITNRTIKEENTMIAQCLYQSDPKNLASMGRQRLACQRAARKLQWGVQKERISETNEPVPLLMRPAVKEILQDAEQHRFDVLHHNRHGKGLGHIFIHLEIIAPELVFFILKGGEHDHWNR